MTGSNSEQRQLQNIADGLLADECFASLVALFNDQPLPVRRGSAAGDPRNARRRRGTVHRFVRRPEISGPHVLWLLAACGVPAALTIAMATGVSAYLVGMVLIVPAFLLLARRGNTGRSR